VSTNPRSQTGVRQRSAPFRFHRFVVAVVLAGAIVGIPGAAWAAKRLAIVASEGGASDRPVRAQITKALKKNKVKVVGKPKTAAPSDDEGWVVLGRKLKVDGFVVLGFDASGKKQGKKRSVEVTIRNAGDGASAGSETFRAKGTPKKLAATVGKGFWRKLEGAIDQVGATKGQRTGMPARELPPDRPVAATQPKPWGSEPEPSPAPPAAPLPQEKSPESKPEPTQQETAATPVVQKEPAKKTDQDFVKAGRLPALILTVAPHLMSRSFSYTPTSAAPTTTMAMPTIAGDATLFPISNLGLGVNVGGEFASWFKYLNQYPTITTELRASLIFRMQLWFGQLFAHAGGFRHFTAAQDDGTRTRSDQALPDVVYTGARMGAGGRFWLTDAISAGVTASYRLTTSVAGGTYGLTTKFYFPGAVPGPGLDATLAIALRVSSVLEIQAGADVRRYLVATRPTAGTRINAAYAVDQYVSGWVGLAGVIGGH